MALKTENGSCTSITVKANSIRVNNKVFGLSSKKTAFNMIVIKWHSLSYIDVTDSIEFSAPGNNSDESKMMFAQYDACRWK